MLEKKWQQNHVNPTGGADSNRRYECVAKDVRRNPPADLSAVCDRADHSLDRADAHAEFVMERELPFEKRLQFIKKWLYKALIAKLSGRTYHKRTL